MARNYAPVCRYCRREGLKLMLKGVRCETAKCPIEKEYRNKPPGMHAWRRGKTSEYGVRLREKQKVKRYYGLLENQFQRFFAMALKGTDNTGVNLLQLLERRLDNVVFKAGLANSRRTARQMVAHGHLHVNGRRVDRPGYLVRVGDAITVRGAERSQNYVKSQIGEDVRPPQAWLVTEFNKLTARVIALPQREDVLLPVAENLIVEFCSR
ncbi:MAG: 30S ribosomal protein S4 [Planctomycetia bacterium]|nr:MAG: 30S ribosomal protein S4 [Planctomycetia bacterium]